MELNYLHLFLPIAGAVVIAIIGSLKPTLFLFFADEKKKDKLNGFFFTFFALCSVILPVYLIINIVDLRLLVMIAICVVLLFIVRGYYRRIKKEE